MIWVRDLGSRSMAIGLCYVRSSGMADVKFEGLSTDDARIL